MCLVINMKNRIFRIAIIMLGIMLVNLIMFSAKEIKELPEETVKYHNVGANTDVYEGTDINEVSDDLIKEVLVLL